MGQKLWEKNVQVNAEIDRLWRISRCSKVSVC